jgi:RNA polymerase sigma factor (sigma-70 family)
MTFTFPHPANARAGWLRAASPVLASWIQTADALFSAPREEADVEGDKVVEFASHQEYEDIVEKHYRSLYLFALSLARNEHDAWDLTHETMVKWVKQNHRIRDRSKTKTWLFTTLYRTFLDLARKRVRHDSFDASDDSATPVQLMTHDAPDARKVDRERVLVLLQGLPEKFRAPLTLFYLEDCSYREIAEILSIRPGTVMSRLSRAKAMLAERIEGAPPPPPPKS